MDGQELLIVKASKLTSDTDVSVLKFGLEISLDTMFSLDICDMCCER